MDFRAAYSLISSFSLQSNHQKTMKIKLVAIAALLLASIYPSTASAERVITGKIAPVTIAFTYSYQAGIFPSEKKTDGPDPTTSDTRVVARSSTLYKEFYGTSTKTVRYSNAQFIASLIDSSYLPGEVTAKWRIVYAEISSLEIRGFFAVSTEKNPTVVFIGDYNESMSPSDFPISITQSPYGSISDETATHRNDRVNYDNINARSIGAYKSASLSGLYFAPSRSDFGFIGFGSLAEQGTYNNYTDYNDESKSVSTYTAGAKVLSGILGYGESRFTKSAITIAGSLTIDALVDVKDLSAYVTAYNDAHSG